MWQARGRHAGTAADDVLRLSLRQLKDSGAIDDYLELPEDEAAQEWIFEARWRVAGSVTVRARLTVEHGTGSGQEWVLVAEAEAPWDPRWPSPAEMFWPREPDAAWDHDAVTGLRLTDINPLPADDKAVRRVLRDSARDGWSIHVVVHEAMTTDQRGRVPLAGMLPPSLRHRVVEHRAAPSQLRVVNWALREFGVEVPRGGAVVLPGSPAPAGYDADDFAVRSVFLDGSEPAELIHAVTRFAALPRPVPEGAEEAVTALREDWRLLTLEEELDRERKLVAMYAEALDAMTKSRDLYREAAEQAHAALAAFRESADAVPEPRPQPASSPATSPLQQLTRTFERLKGSARTRKPSSDPGDPQESEAAEEQRESADR
ncbi:hypothetical protein ACM01_00090 [Streptomyces viridochromogenes]|uniref:Uncharacterized protein n=1 Tax=Streptomyces viridochromogenes TaxID=1938 RepID=A0A0J7ZN14_STRVR|nr:hypothetical protein ACM01_00090 [Streptomyces viridochromogenes]KOG09448.1 hypothetical protein ADK35_39835 [Streptomyces viridochromogenes]KOG27379.1 hypothetical protein ADK36_01400 [Streptomyces viridochromogenes]